MKNNKLKSFLKKIELFKAFEDAELEKIIKIIELKIFEKDTILYEQNFDRKNTYIVLKGEVELYKSTSFGEEIQITQFQKYDFIGEGAIVDDSPHSTSARTVTDCEIYIINANTFKELLNNDGKIAVKIFTEISQIISRRMIYLL